MIIVAMYSNKKYLVFLLAFYGFFDYALAQDGCTPDTVQLIHLSAERTLSWYKNPDEHCEITHYQVDIEGELGDSYHFNVSKNFVRLSFIDTCEEWTFTIHPSSYDVIGMGRSVTMYIPLPRDADLSLKYFDATRQGDGSLLLDWDLNDHSYENCTLEYAIYAQDESGWTQYAYTESSSMSLNLSPCMTYDLSMRAINIASPNVEGPLIKLPDRIEIPPRPQEAPRLQSIDVQTTSFIMDVEVEGRYNKCPLISLHVIGTDFNLTVPLDHMNEPHSIPVVVTSLRPGSMYFVQVIVENSGGMSPALQVAVQTLDDGNSKSK